jgi:ribonucleoside-diphosphate reductase alpha chain
MAKRKKEMGLKIKKLERREDVYDITVDKVHNFFANSILVHNCEINLPTKPLRNIDDEEGEISLCTLAAINWGRIRKPEDFEKPCMLAVRCLDALLDYQNYPIKAAHIGTMNRRPLGIGIINFAYWLAKNGTNYQEPNLELIHQYAEAWSYYLIKASVDLVKEKGACLKSDETKYALGILPIDTYKKDVDELVKPVYNMDWDSLRNDLKQYGIRNSTLMALMPAETSAQISNSTNGIEPPRSLISVKQSKDGVLKQVVPEYQKLKNKYDLLWNQKSPDGYLKIMAVLQKFIDQGISVNTSYNPLHYEGEKIPLSTLMKDILNFYKYGGKQLYYNNTFDGAGEYEEKPRTELTITIDNSDCDSCKI